MKNLQNQTMEKLYGKTKGENNLLIRVQQAESKHQINVKVTIIILMERKFLQAI